VLEGRVRAKGAADLTKSTDVVEIGIYEGGSGLIRTYEGSLPVAGTHHGSFRCQH
jgi:hypothetical protein